jgi:hypothetical protein
VHETCYYGVLHALLAGKNHWKEWNRQYGRRVTRIDDLLRQDRNRWAIAQKTPRGLFLLDATLREMLSHQGVQPDTWILPSKVGVYLQMVPSNVVSVQEAGPSKSISDNNSNQGTARTLTTFRGAQVCETRPFDMDFSGEASELLRREKMIGEYYQMLVTDSPKQSAVSGYRTDQRSIFIYNCDVDRFEKVQITDAIDNCFRWDKDTGLPDGDHDYIQKGYGIPSARDVSLRDDPMMCHHGVSVDKAPNGICAWLGDLPSEHFSNADVRDWADSLKQATKHHGGTGVSPNECSTFLKDILNTTAITNYDERCLTGAGFTAGIIGAQVDPVWGVFNTPNLNEPLISSLQDSWDPSLSSAVLGDSHPQMAYIPQLSEQQILQRFHGGFPEMWKSLVNADDFHEIRASVVDQVKAAPSDSHRLNILKRANGIYEKALTEKAISRRSQLADAGVLDRALMELQAPTKKSRSAAVKETKAFLEKFGSTVQYFQQLNEERPLDGLTLLQEIVRDYIQPLNARDAQEMEARLEAHIESGDALTPQLLDQWKMELTKDSIESNLSKLARALKPAGVQIDGATARRDAARTNRGGYRTTIQNAIGTAARPAAPVGIGVPDKRSEEWKARMPLSGDKSLNALFRCMFCHIRLNRTVLQKFAEYDIIIPFGFMLTRPFIRYDMCSGILAQAGSDLGVSIALPHALSFFPVLTTLFS